MKNIIKATSKYTGYCIQNNSSILQVRDGSQVGNLLGRFCGSTIPDPVMSTDNVMWVRYRTDYSVSGTGFHAMYISGKYRAHKVM